MRVEEATGASERNDGSTTTEWGKTVDGAVGIAGARSRALSPAPPRADHALGRLRLPSIALDRESRAV